MKVGDKIRKALENPIVQSRNRTLRHFQYLARARGLNISGEKHPNPGATWIRLENKYTGALVGQIEYRPISDYFPCRAAKTG